MENIQSNESKNVSQRKIKLSSKLFGVGVAMLPVMGVLIAMGGQYGAVLAAGISGTAFALAIHAFTKEKKQ